MKDLIRAQMYQILRTRVYFWVFIACLALAVLFGVSEYLNGADDLDEGMLLTASDFFTRCGMIATLFLGFSGFFVSFFTGDDFKDKTANYELMSGRLRKQSFFARVTVTVVFNILLGSLMMVLPLTLYSLLTGWGNSIPVSAAVTRILLMAFPFFRQICFYILLTYIIKRPGYAFLACYGYMCILTLLPAQADPTGTVLAFTSIQNLLHFDYWATFGLERDAQVIYDPNIDTALAVRIIISSLAAGAAYLWAAYSYFHKDDIE